jgi:ribosomal protein S18 acetylase RimI-like enzyme
VSRPSRKPLDKDLYADVVAEAKSRFDVWPSAYASGWVVKTYKARGGRYAGGDRKTRSGLTKWFGESWVDLSRPIHDEDGELVGYEPCGRKKSDDPAAYPKCRPLAEAMRMSPSEVKDAIKRKRAAEAKAGRGGRGGRGARAPVRVSTYRANPANAVFDWELPGTRGIREVTVDDVTILYGYNGESAHIASVRTKIKAQGQGKARRVLELFCEEADALGIPIRLEASPLTKKVNRARLVAFYESLGFEKTGRTINPAGDPELVRLPVRANPMRQPEDAPGFRIAVLEHQKPGAFKGRIILAAYTDDGQMLAWIAATPTTLRTAKAFAKDGQGVPRSSFPELTGYDDADVVWTVGRSHAWVDGWGPLLYEALLAFVASKGYSGWVTSDTTTTSNKARAVWRRFSERDDVEFREDVGRNVSGEPIDAMRALPALLERRFPLLEQADKSGYPWRIKQLLDRGRVGEDGRFSVEGLDDVDEARANPDVTSTQAFRRWFGDSKVVDAAGEPLVVYHGTDKSFDVFKSTTKEAFYGKGGMYFSNVREAAQTFAPSVENVMPVYLALQNPYFDDGEDAGVTIAKLKRRGFDGIVREADFVDEDGDVQDHTIYVAFYPEQIKLADGTNTTFDPKSPDVRFNPRPNGDALAAWCASDESYAVLDETASAGSSWMAGACVLLAKAIRKRHPEARLVGIETDGVIQHVGARIGDTVYDALGEHDPHAWARDWLAYEQLPARTLVRVVSLKGTPRSAFPDAESPATPADVALVARALP